MQEDPYLGPMAQPLDEEGGSPSEQASAAATTDDVRKPSSRSKGQTVSVVSRAGTQALPAANHHSESLRKGDGRGTHRNESAAPKQSTQSADCAAEPPGAGRQLSINEYATARSRHNGFPTNAQPRPERELPSDSPLRALPSSFLKKAGKAAAQSGGSVTGDVVGYSRRSNASDNQSIARQQEGHVVYAESKGDVLQASYADIGISGATLIGRSGLNEIMARAQRGEIKRILVDDHSRIGRSMSILSTFYEQLTDLGIEIHSVRKGGKLELIDICIGGLMSAEERAGITRSCIDGRMRMARNGRWPTGAFLGYKGVPGRPGILEPDENQKDIVVSIFKLYFSDTSPRHIAMILNREKIPSPRNKRWSATCVRAILSNPMYVGILAYGRKRYYTNYRTGEKRIEAADVNEWAVSEVPHLRIVSDELFAAAQVKLAPRAYSRRTDRRTYILSRRVICPKCGGVMSPRTSKEGVTKISCHNAKTDPDVCEHTRLYPMDKLESAAITMIGGLLSGSDCENEYRSTFEVSHSHNLKRWTEQLREAELKVQQLRKRLSDGFISAERAAGLQVLPEHIALFLEQASGHLNEAEVLRDRCSAELRRLKTFDSEGITSLRDALDEVAAAVPFRPEDEAGRHVFASLRALIDRLEIVPREGERTVDLRMMVHLSPLLEPGSNNESTVVLTGSCEVDRRSRKQTSKHKVELNRLVRSNYRFMNDDIWRVVEKSLGKYRTHGALKNVSRRHLMDVIFCCLRIGLPFGQASIDVIGCKKQQLSRVAEYLVYKGYWQSIVSALSEAAPDFLNGVEVDFHARSKDAHDKKRRREGQWVEATKHVRAAKRADRQAGRLEPNSAKSLILSLLRSQSKLTTAEIDCALKSEGLTIWASQKARSFLLSAGLISKNVKLWLITDAGRASP